MVPLKNNQKETNQKKMESRMLLEESSEIHNPGNLRTSPEGGTPFAVFNL
jgi:hypothetical protein